MALIRPDGGFVLSPSDLTASAACEFGWLRGIDVRLRRAEKVVADDPLGDRIARLGDAHEARELDRLRADRAVMEVARPTPYDAEGLQRAADETHQALLAGAEVIAQGVLYDGEFGGMADFLVRGDDGRYEVRDAKLARRARVSALLQLAAYADQLDRLGVPRASDGYLLLGDRTRFGQDLDVIIPVYRRRRRYLAERLGAHLAQPDPVAWGDDRFSICGSCPVCDAEKGAADDLLLVAGLTRLQRQRLRAAGVRSMTELAASTESVADLPERTWRTLRDQAALQAEATGQVGFEIFDPMALDLLPEPDPGDVFFDFEGDPLWTDTDGIASGLEYLFGLVDLDEPTGRFTAFWAHDRAEERQALIDFFDQVAKRRASYPGMHIYHYAPYEPTALKRLAVRHAYGEDQLDDLLRQGVFVDLYAAVRRSVRVSQPSYSIKKLEPLYMGERLRTENGVTTAADSVLQYHEFAGARARGDHAEADRLLADIADYNEYDCLSTWKLRDWLRSHRAASGAPAVAEESASRAPSRLDELQAVADKLLELIPADRGDRDQEQHGIALLAAALGYYRREDKPTWWAYFDRGVSPVDEWADPRDTVVAGSVEVINGWQKATAGAKALTRTLRLTGRLDPGTSLATGTEVRTVYEDIPAQIVIDPGAHRGIAKGISKVLSIDLDDAGNAIVEVEERTRAGGDPFDELPMAIFRYSFIPTNSLEDSVRAMASQVLQAGGLPVSAASDILARRAPRLTSGAFDATAAGDAVSPARLAATLRSLDHSYIAVQGPPGAGKTHLGSRVVADLVAAGWKVGVVAQGHATVEQFLDKVVDAGVDGERVGKVPKDAGDARAWTALRKDQIEEFLAGEDGRVVGGTAWTFAPLPPGSLDLLVIDEAGQFSLAHTIAASLPARSVLLLGDPQQLPQVSQGSHPEPVDSSALGWLAEGHDTLPADRGYFLARTWRMHSALTADVSTLAYDDKLVSNTVVTDARELSGVAPGLHSLEVPHAGNSVMSAEEADAVVELVRRLDGLPWRSEADRDRRPLQPDDVIVVAAYNAQVAAIRRALDAAGYSATDVGTVDKFQGREAPVSIVSLAASSAADVPRGLEFLLDRRRLNVAISRAQYASFLVHSPALGDTLPTSVEGLVQLGSFLRLSRSAA